MTSGRRISAAAVLREVENLDDTTLIAVVDAAVRWLEEPADDEYPWALLGALTDAPTHVRAYGELLGNGGGWCRARRDGGLVMTADLRSNEREAVWTWRRLLLRTIDDGGI